jgi:nitric oxide synthase oxygenase domain/subunit
VATVPENPLALVTDTEVTVPEVNCEVVAKVPEVGKVTDVLPVIVKVDVKAPEVVKLPPKVIVEAPLFTPVPPYVAPITEPCQVPVPIVPNVVIEDCPT